MYTINEVVGQNMKKIRLAKKLTQKQVAQATGVSRQTLSNAENQMGCSTKTLEILAEYLGVSPLSFFLLDGQNGGGLSFSRVRNNGSDTAETTEDFAEKVGELAKSYAENLKQGLYFKCVVPTIDGFFDRNTQTMFDRLGVANGRENTKTMGQFRNALLTSVRKSIFLDDEPDELINE